MITIIEADGRREREQLEAMRARAAQKNKAIELAVSSIMENVKEEGLPAVERYTREFDHRMPYEVPNERLEQAYQSCPPELISALEHAADNIRDYNQRLLTKNSGVDLSGRWDCWEDRPGTDQGWNLCSRWNSRLPQLRTDERHSRQGGWCGGDHYGDSSYR